METKLIGFLQVYISTEQKTTKFLQLYKLARCRLALFNAYGWIGIRVWNNKYFNGIFY